MKHGSDYSSRRVMIRVGIALVVAFLSLGRATASTYLSAVEGASVLLARGQYHQAIQAFQKARDLNLNDPLAAAGLGYALESDGQMMAARGELALALQLSSSNKTVQWASALSALNGGRLKDARQQLEAMREQQEMHSPDLWIALAYARCAAGEHAAAAEALNRVGDVQKLTPPQRSVASLVAGAAAYAAGQHARAAELLTEAARSLPPSSFFDKGQRRRVPVLPEARTAFLEPLPLVSSPYSPPRNARTIAYTVRLYLDLFRFPEAKFAVFLIDGRIVHTTNLAPLRYDWDTRRWPNGYHKVTIRAQDAYGEVIGETDEILLVSNKDGAASEPAPEGYDRAESALRRAMVLQPDTLATHYLLGISLARVGNHERAAASLELVMAYDPDYGKARQELQAIYSSRNGGHVREVSSVPTASKKIAITFDDGPHPLYTPPLLDLLERYNAHCTMFLVGTQAEAHPDIVREIMEKGHEIANHTYSHPNLRTLDRRTIELELLRGRSTLRRITGKSVELFRPPGGNADGKVAEICAAYGFTTVYWDVFDSWLQKYDEATVLTRLVAGIKSGSIVLLHNGNNKTARIVEPLLAEMSRQGYQMVTVSQLLAERTPGVTPPTDAPEAPELQDETPKPPAPGASTNGKRAPGKT